MERWSWHWNEPLFFQNGFHLFTIVEDFSGSIPLLIVGLTELAAVTWIYGIKRYSKDVSLMLGHPPNIFFRVTWTALSPAILGVSTMTTSWHGTWWRHQMGTFSALLAGDRWIPLTMASDAELWCSSFIDLRLNKRLSKQSIRGWFETPWRSL